MKIASILYWFKIKLYFTFKRYFDFNNNQIANVSDRDTRAHPNSEVDNSFGKSYCWWDTSAYFDYLFAKG